MKRTWLQIHLSTAVLAMLLLGTAVQLNLSGKFAPMGIFVFDEFSWKHYPSDSRTDESKVYFPPRQRIIMALPDDDYYCPLSRELGFPFVFGKCAPDTSTANIIRAIRLSSFKESNRYTDGFEPLDGPCCYDLLISPWRVVYDGLCWIGIIVFFCFAHEWLLRRSVSQGRRVISLSHSRLRTAMLFVVATVLVGLQAIERVGHTEKVNNGNPNIHNMVGVAQFYGRGWPFVFKYSSPVELPFPTLPANPTIEVDTAIDVWALCSDIIVGAIILLALRLFCGLALATRRSRHGPFLGLEGQHNLAWGGVSEPRSGDETQAPGNRAS